MHSSKFHGSKFDEDLGEFLDKAYRIVAIMGVPTKEKVELVAYQLKGLPKVWYNQWVDERGIEVG